jgi:hypothetical protein
MGREAGWPVLQIQAVWAGDFLKSFVYGLNRGILKGRLSMFGGPM